MPSASISCCMLPDIAIGIEAGGIEFIDENGGGPGVRLRNRQRPKQRKLAPPLGPWRWYVSLTIKLSITD